MPSLEQIGKLAKAGLDIGMNVMEKTYEKTKEMAEAKEKLKHIQMEN